MSSFTKVSEYSDPLVTVYYSVSPHNTQTQEEKHSIPSRSAVDGYRKESQAGKSASASNSIVNPPFHGSRVMQVLRWEFLLHWRTKALFSPQLVHIFLPQPFQNVRHVPTSQSHNSSCESFIATPPCKTRYNSRHSDYIRRGDGSRKRGWGW